MKDLYFFGTTGVGEVVFTTPILKYFSKYYKCHLCLPFRKGLLTGIFEDIDFFDLIPLERDEFESYRPPDLFYKRHLVLKKKFLDKIDLNNSMLYGKNWFDIIDEDYKSLPNQITKTKWRDLPTALRELKTNVNQTLAELGADVTKDKYYITPKFDKFKNTGKKKVITIANSWEPSRRISIKTVSTLSKRLSDYKVNYCGVIYPDESKDLKISGESISNEESGYKNLGSDDKNDYEKSKEILSFLYSSDLVIGPESGWINVAYAMEVPSILLRSRCGYKKGELRRTFYENLELISVKALSYSHLPQFVNIKPLSCNFSCLETNEMTCYDRHNMEYPYSTECLDYNIFNINRLISLIKEEISKQNT